jgi:DNA-directed RNA polymerase specialized sigma subunit
MADKARNLMLAERIRNGNKEAEQTFVCENEPLLVKICKSVGGRMEFADKLQVARLSAINAARNFDGKRGDLACYLSMCVKRDVIAATKVDERSQRKPDRSDEKQRKEYCPVRETIKHSKKDRPTTSKKGRASFIASIYLEELK